MAQQPSYQGYSDPDYVPQPGDQYENGVQQGYEAAPGGAPPPPATGGGGRRKRQYAGQAYDFGAGGNAGQAGQHGGSFSGAPVGGYGYDAQQQQPGFQPQPYGTDYGMPAPAVPPYGQPAAVGGYQPPDAGYPAHSAAPMAGGVDGITHGMSNMGMGGQPAPAAQGMLQRGHMNQLYPTDLLNQPFNVQELDLPPPAIILPPNVGTPCEF